MFKWFQNLSSDHPRVTIASLRFNATGWFEQEKSESRIVWSDAESDFLTADLIMGSLDLPPLTDHKKLIKHARHLARPGAIVSVDVVTESLVPLVQVIYKRDVHPGYVYTGILKIPFKGCGYYIAGVFRERGMTGERESVAAAKLLEEGTAEIDFHAKVDAAMVAGINIKGWFRDPYEPDYKGTVLHNLGDDARFDEFVPHHPLSKMRRTLRTIASTLEADDELKKHIPGRHSAGAAPGAH